MRLSVEAAALAAAALAAAALLAAYLSGQLAPLMGLEGFTISVEQCGVNSMYVRLLNAGSSDIVEVEAFVNGVKVAVSDPAGGRPTVRRGGSAQLRVSGYSAMVGDRLSLQVRCRFSGGAVVVEELRGVKVTRPATAEPILVEEEVSVPLGSASLTRRYGYVEDGKLRYLYSNDVEYDLAGLILEGSTIKEALLQVNASHGSPHGEVYGSRVTICFNDGGGQATIFSSYAEPYRSLYAAEGYIGDGFSSPIIVTCNVTEQLAKHPSGSFRVSAVHPSSSASFNASAQLLLRVLAPRPAGVQQPQGRGSASIILACDQYIKNPEANKKLFIFDASRFKDAESVRLRFSGVRLSGSGPNYLWVKGLTGSTPLEGVYAVPRSSQPGEAVSVSVDVTEWFKSSVEEGGLCGLCIVYKDSSAPGPASTSCQVKNVCVWLEVSLPAG